MSNQPRAVTAISGATISAANSWVLTSSGVAVDTQTITIGGVVFTTVTTIGTTAGNVLIGLDAAATITNLVALINAPSTTTSTGVALSADDAYKIKTLLGLTAVGTTTTVTLTSSVVPTPVIAVSETETNFAWTVSTTSAGIPGNQFGISSLQLVATGITSGNGVFTVQVSNDGVYYTDYNRLTTNATNTNAQTDTRVASVTLSSNASSFVTIPDPCAFFRVKVVPTTDGTYSATAYTV